MSLQTAILEAPEVPLPPPLFDARADEEWVDDEAYRELFVSVIELAIKDYEFLLRIRRQDQLTPSERKKLRGHAHQAHDKVQKQRREDDEHHHRCRFDSAGSCLNKPTKTQRPVEENADKDRIGNGNCRALCRRKHAQQDAEHNDKCCHQSGQGRSPERICWPGR